MYDLKPVHKSWKPIINRALATLPSDYFATLASTAYLPKPEQVFAAFQLPIEQVNYVLLGESPYPRIESANGFAFWDQAVQSLWSDQGFSKPLNRATSLRNFLKMLLVTHGLLDADNTSQAAIVAIDKKKLVPDLNSLFTHFLEQGFLLLNATPILRDKQKNNDAKIWQSFLNQVLLDLHQHRPQVKLILLGKIAAAIQNLSASQLFTQIIAEHPYNLSFIHNKTMQDFFRPLRLIYSNG